MVGASAGDIRLLAEMTRQVLLLKIEFPPSCFMRKTMAGIYLWMVAYDYSAVNLISAPFRSGELNETLISPASPVVWI